MAINKTDKFSTLYNISFNVVLNRDTVINLKSEEIVSISLIHDYDHNSYPCIRVRIYTDIDNVSTILQYPDDIYVRCNMVGGIYRINDNDYKNPVLVTGTNPIIFSLKAYIENKNIPTSTMDKYVDGIRKSTDLNDNVKVPLELYCYDEYVIHNMTQRAPSIYIDSSLTTSITDMLNRYNIRNIHIDPLNNQNKYDQILCPNLSIIDAIAFYDSMYGLYEKGGAIYGDIDKLYITNTNVINGTTPIPIQIRSMKNNDDTSGMIKVNYNKQHYRMITNTPNVSIITESDIERVLNSYEMSSINLNDLGINIEELKNLYSNLDTNSNSAYIKSRLISDGLTNTNKIETPSILHKTKNEYILKSYIARLDEHITKVDLSGVGFDISGINIRSRFNLIFDSAIRGINANMIYRPTYVCHVLSNLGNDLFIAETVMKLCSN